MHDLDLGRRASLPELHRGGDPGRGLSGGGNASDRRSVDRLLKAEDGATYAAEAAEFWDAFSGRQTPPKLAECADNHSLDRQSAYNILCWVGGSNEAIFRSCCARAPNRSSGRT
jgi:hypothetical protein